MPETLSAPPQALSALLMVESNGVRRVHFLDANERRCTMEMGTSAGDGPSHENLVLSIESLHPIALTQGRVKELLPWLQTFAATGKLEPDIVQHLLNKQIVIRDFIARNQKPPSLLERLKRTLGWESP